MQEKGVSPFKVFFAEELWKRWIFARIQHSDHFEDLRENSLHHSKVIPHKKLLIEPYIDDVYENWLPNKYNLDESNYPTQVLLIDIFSKFSLPEHPNELHRENEYGKH